ncbi:MAG: OsmC family protein [Actinomycetia bacterium]|nr:OsmC family protein [Actinomycetes bacterium]
MMAASSASPDAPRIRTIRLTSRSAEDLRTVARVRDFTVIGDEPRALGGQDSGPTPMEWVLAGLASCMTVTARLVARELGLELGPVSFSLEGDLDVRGLFGQADVRPDFQTVRGTLRLGSSLPPAALDQLREAVLRRSPAYQLFRAAGVALHIDWIAGTGAEA